MIAALAPVVDLVMLDPNNPRSVAYQVDRIETHLEALPTRQAAGRLSPVQQLAASIATRFRTADAASLDDVQIVAIENDLMKLSETIASTYLTISSGRRPLGILCRDEHVPMIYDIARQLPDLCVGGDERLSRAAPDADQSARQRVQVSSLRIEPEPVSWREGQDFFGNRLTWIALEEAQTF